MDQYGIGNTMKTALEMYSQTARQTGRTYQMLQNIKPGDTIVFFHREEARRIEGLLKKIGMDDKVKCVVTKYTELDLVHRDIPELRSTRHKRLVLDHGWIEKYYENQLKSAAENIDDFIQELTHSDRKIDPRTDWQAAGSARLGRNKHKG